MSDDAKVIAAAVGNIGESQRLRHARSPTPDEVRQNQTLSGSASVNSGEIASAWKNMTASAALPRKPSRVV